MKEMKLADRKKVGTLGADDFTIVGNERYLDTYAITNPYEGMFTPPQNRDRTVPVRTEPKVQRNESCPCGSKKKYKKCCLNKKET